MFSHKIIHLPVLCLSVFLIMPCARADDTAMVAPLYVRNLSPVAALFGLPGQYGAQVGMAGQWQWALHGSLASQYVVDQRQGEWLNFDGETHQLTLAGRWVFADQWQLQLELPWREQNGGFMDGTIDNWHDLWGMPDNGRSDVSRDLFGYRYYDSRGNSPDHAQQIFDLTSHGGMGDVSLAVQRGFYIREGFDMAFVLGYKFGTGDTKNFSGSGEGDVYAALRFSGVAGRWPLHWHAQAGYLRAGQVAMLGMRQQRDLWFAGASLVWPLDVSWALIGQFDSHAAPMDSALDALGDNAMMLSVGLRRHLSEHWLLDVLIIEDVAVETAPDVIFQGSLRYRPGR